MPERVLPPRPNLEQYKKQAKELLRAFHDGHGDALLRFKQHQPSTSLSDVGLADAQRVIASEHGFRSWPEFAAAIQRIRVQNALADVVDPHQAFLKAASVPCGTWHGSGTLDEAEAIRARFPEVERASIYGPAVLGDVAQLEERIAHDAALAKAPGGPYQWEPLVYLCFSRYLRLDPSRSESFTACARLLLQAGADPNGGWYEQPDHQGGKPVFESVLYGAAGLAQHAGVTRLLLEYGANPNDGETPYHAPESYDNTVLQILLESGRLDERSKAWILGRKADWHDDAGMRMALEHGASPNYVPHWGRSALHHSILRDNGLVMQQMLLDRDADALLRSSVDGLTAAQLAARRGRGDVLDELTKRGLDPGLKRVDCLIAACARADRDAVQSLLAAEPDLRDELLPIGGELLATFSGNANAGGLECLLDLGVPVDGPYNGDPYFDIARASTALHVATWRGWPNATKVLLARGANVNAKDGKGRTPLQRAVTACTDSYWKRRRSPEWIAPLLDAGASLDGVEIPCGYAEADALLLRHAERST